MKDIRTLSLDQLQEYFVSLGEKPFRAKQVYDWLWSKNMHSIEEMTNLSKDLRDRISQEYMINPISVDQLQRSKDGTIYSSTTSLRVINTTLLAFHALRLLLCIQ